MTRPIDKKPFICNPCCCKSLSRSEEENSNESKNETQQFLDEEVEKTDPKNGSDYSLKTYIDPQKKDQK